MMRPSRSAGSRRTVLAASVVAALGAIVALVGCTPASASDVRVHRTVFGMHDGTTGSRSLGTVHPGAVRLWDVGVQWRDVETHRNGHRYDWTRLDALVRAAQRHHAEVTMVVAGTPRFYSKNPWNVPAARIPAYRAFVAALMKRYRNFHGERGIAAYQVWNEGNISTFWTGSFGRLARLTRALAQVRHRNDPHARVVAPSMVTRLHYQLRGLSRYYHQRVDGKPVARYVDAVALSMYPLPRYGGRTGVPEDAMRQLRQVRTILHRAGVSRAKPVWNTEVNYGLQSGGRGGTAAARISGARQVANVMRTYLLNAAAGVRRVFWYRYDWGRLPTGGTLGNTLLTSPTDSSTVLAPGRAFLRIQRWMHGTLVGGRHARPCQQNRHGTYTCVVKDAAGNRRIYWNPFRTAEIRLARNAHHLTDEFGHRSAVRPHATIRVGYRPVMVGR